MVSIDVFSEHGKELIETKFKNILDTEIKYASELLTHDGYDEGGPQSDIWTLYVCVESLQSSIYTYYCYSAENWFDSKDKIEYTASYNPISSKYLIVPNSQGKYLGKTQTYYDSMWRVVNYFSNIPEDTPNKISKNDIENVNIFINNIKMDTINL
jgi:hypothetical protein